MLEKHGKPTATIATDLFCAMGQRAAEATSMPYLPIIITKHPVAILGVEELRERAKQMAYEVASVLTTPADNLEKRSPKLPQLARSSTPV